MKLSEEKAIVLFSGGQDSTTCLVSAMRVFKEVEAISFDYGQKHLVERTCAQQIARKLKVPLTYIDDLKLHYSSLVGETAEAQEKNKQVSTFVPARNYLFLGLAAAYAYSQDIKNIIIGVNQVDYSGYPDCRKESIKAVQQALRLCLDYPMLIIKTPFLTSTKAQIVQRGFEMLGKKKFNEIFALTHTCYKGKRPACGVCNACKIRLQGFREAGIPDPIEYEKQA